MAETIIKAEHRAQLARMQHVLEWLQAEAVRLQAELAHTMAAGQREQGELVSFLAREYGVNTPLLSLDAERGVFVTADRQEGPAPTVADVQVEVEAEAP